MAASACNRSRIAQGIFGQLGPQATHYPPLTPGLFPLKAGSLVPAENPIWAMLNASLAPGATFGASVVVDGQTWPAMPPPPIDEFQIWVDANATAPRLVDAFGDWITAGKIDDSPQAAPFNYASLSTAPVAPWPLKPQEATAVLFVASMPNDGGRRPGDSALPNPPAVAGAGQFLGDVADCAQLPAGRGGARGGHDRHAGDAEARRGILGAGAGRQCQRRRRGRDHQPQLSEVPGPGRRAVLQHLHQPGHVAAVARQHRSGGHQSGL